MSQNDGADRIREEQTIFHRKSSPMTLIEQLFEHDTTRLPKVERISDPQFGNFPGSQINKYLDHLKRWQTDVRRIEFNLINEINTAQRRVEEVELTISESDRSYVLPTCTVIDNMQAGTDVRIYYSNFPISQTHQVRHKLLPADHHLSFPDPVAAYQVALAAGDLENVVDVFAPGAIVREPSGGAFVATGKEGLTQFYSFLFSFGGGAPLEHCSETTDDRSCAIEYNIVQVGTHRLVPQAGIAVYDWAGSQLTGARIYDDFEPPTEGT